jgi:hypothetical protein
MRWDAVVAKYETPTCKEVLRNPMESSIACSVAHNGGKAYGHIMS